MTDVKNIFNKLKNFQERSVTRKNLEQEDPEEIGQELLDYLFEHDLEDNVIWAVISAFGYWKWQPAVPFLIHLLENDSPFFLEIIRILKKITGEDHDGDTNAWLKAHGGKTETDEIEAPEISNFDESLEKAFKDKCISFEKRDSFIKIIFQINETRKQQILLSPRENGNSILIYTECGETDKKNETSVFQLNDNLEFGELKTEKIDNNTIKIILSHQQNFTNYAADDIFEKSKRLATIADSLEDQLTGQDII